ncbi:MAG: SDR family NAD(P)-dependent oxidoreductase [Beijerinckiaceae bacterium]
MPLALITGGASLICEGVAQCLARDGWDLAITDLNLDGARTVASRVEGGGRVETHALDARKIGDVDALVRDLAQRYGTIDGLVNGAGGARGIGFQRKPFVETSQEEWESLLNSNLNTVLNVTRTVLPVMIAARRGAIVSIAASRGLRGGPGASIYSAAKAGIIVFTQSIAQEVGKHGVRVNSIAPGNAEARWKKDDADARSPLGRNTNAQDVGDAVAFLMSARAQHITGACLDVSGGTALH